MGVKILLKFLDLRMGYCRTFNWLSHSEGSDKKP